MPNPFHGEDQTYSSNPSSEADSLFVEAGDSQPSPASTYSPRRSPRRVELVYFDGCPNWRTADRHLRTMASELGFQLHHRVVTSSEDAEAAGFHGSPTILLDGRDPFAWNAETLGLSCRVYNTPGGAAGSPTLEQLRSVLND